MLDGSTNASTDLDLGVVGVNEGNGHPYSFASIVNGYSDDGFAGTDWGVIHDYLAEKDDSEFGFPGVRVTHAWTQDDAETDRLCAAARIPNALADLADMRDAVDAVLLLRDDYERHVEMALPFLEAGLPVFVDKPLACSVEDARTFRPYLEDGQLMSCSGMRFARELDGPRTHLDEYGEIRLVRAAVLKNWENYGVHMLDAAFGVLDASPVAVRALDANHDSVAVEMDDGSLVQVDALGSMPVTFDVDVYGAERATSHRLRDNFTAFRRTLGHFVDAVRSGSPGLDPSETMAVVRTLIAGRRSAADDGRRVRLDEVDV